MSQPFQQLLKRFVVWIRALLRRPNAAAQAIEHDAQAFSQLPHNPYLQSKVLWNDLYGSLQIKLENSYRILFILAFVIVIAIVGLIVMASKSQVKPYVTVIHGNEVITLDQSSERELHRLQPQLAFYFAQRFIRTLRSVSVDDAVNNDHQLTAYAFVAGAATETLKQFYAQYVPHKLAKTIIKTIQIHSILRTAPHTLEVRWQENNMASQSGERLSSHDYLAQLQYRFDQPSTHSTILRVNPLGFYVTHLSWSEETGTHIDTEHRE